MFQNTKAGPSGILYASSGMLQVCVQIFDKNIHELDYFAIIIDTDPLIDSMNTGEIISGLINPVWNNSIGIW